MSGQNDEAAVKDSAPANVFDLEVKYGALAVALAYMVGYVYEVGFGLRLYVPLAEMQLGTAHLLASGFTILFRSLVPTIFSLACEGLGSRAAEGSGILCVAIVGGAVVPLLTGRAADMLGLKSALAVPAVSYLGILGFGWMARRPHPTLSMPPAQA